MNAWRTKRRGKWAIWAMGLCLGGCAAESQWTGFSHPDPGSILPPALAPKIPAPESTFRPNHWPDAPVADARKLPTPKLNEATTTTEKPTFAACRPVTRKADPIRKASAEIAPPINAPSPLAIPAEANNISNDSSPSTFAVECPPDGLPLDLTSALMMAAGRNPQVAFAQERIREAYAQHQAAEALWLPSLQAGATYYKHEGALQDVRGPVSNISRSGLYSGLGARAVGAGNPALPGLSAQFALTDALHQPDITAWQTHARTHASAATRNQVLLDTALAYLDVLEAYQQQAIAQETLSHAQELAKLTESFAKAGEGSQADADRAATELTLRQNAVVDAEADAKTASARLAELLSQDPSVVIVPTEAALIPLELIACEQSAQALVSQGLQTRPELAESTAMVYAAAKELERVKQAPLLPSVLLGMSYGGFGGGVGDSIANYRDRFDFEATAVWEVRNLGFGEKAARDTARSQQQQAQLREVRLMDQVAREVVEAQTQVEARRRQIDIARQGIETAKTSHQRNLDRIKDGQGLPIEVLQSLQALDAARREYLRVVAGFNEAQFRLQWAIGWPVQ